MAWTIENTFLLCMFLAWTAGVVGAIFCGQKRTIAHTISYTAAFTGSLFGVLTAIAIFIRGSNLHVQLWSIVPNLHFSFNVDMLSAFFLLIISLSSLIVSIYSPSYIKNYEDHKNITWIGAIFNLFVISMAGVVIAYNGFTFLVMWEMMSLVSFFLVMFEHEQTEVRESGLLYVIMTHLGTGFIMIAFLILFYQTGTLEFDAIQILGKDLSSGSQHAVFFLAFIGFGTKAGLVPLHIWLPRAHPVAPSHISALMSAVMIKTALYGIIRVAYNFLSVASIWWGVVVLIIGMISAVYGILYAVVQNDVKRFLAYSSVENMGLIFVGFGTSLIFTALELPVLAGLALLATLYHTLNHTMFKGLLFMGAGAIYQATGTRNMDRLGGLIRYMPHTAGLFLIGALAIASFPPFNGFISKWLTLQSLLNLPFYNDGNIWLSLLGVLAVTSLVFVGGLVAYGFVKAFGVTFLAQPRSDQVENAIEAPFLMRLAMGFMSIGIVLLGVFPGFVSRQLAKVTQIYFPVEQRKFQLFNIQSATESGAELSPILIVIAFTLMIFLTLFLLFKTVGRDKYEHTETWACGVTLRPEMSYSGTSFSHPLLVIFKPIFGDTLVTFIKEQKVYFAITLRQAFDQYFYNPVIRTVLSISEKIRTIQDGSIHSYLAYIFVTLIVLLLVVSIN